jgi:hypothetical protein
MTARPLDPERRRRRPVYAAVALVLVMVAVQLAAGCASHYGNGLCGGKFEVYELADFLKPGDNVVHLTEQDFKENPELDEVLRGAKRTNATCDREYYNSGRCIGGSYYKCGGKVRLIKYDMTNKTPDFNDNRILEYNGKYYSLIFTLVS